ncbi:hypothetical protein AB0I81_22690 [Nonomuraea sp. NPDC050404]|uniref:hypothetical protein n=1 Tax=Nonomuraea sp. NPDC050404 TaxID=3155783 RepID=UPI0033C9D9F8
MAQPIRVTVFDPETGETETRDVQPGDYAVVTCLPCHQTEVQAFASGTHIITVMGVRRG